MLVAFVVVSLVLCSHCGLICASEFGLCSHLRIDTSHPLQDFEQHERLHRTRRTLRERERVGFIYLDSEEKPRSWCVRVFESRGVHNSNFFQPGKPWKLDVNGKSWKTLKRGPGMSQKTGDVPNIRR